MCAMPTAYMNRNYSQFSARHLAARNVLEVCVIVAPGVRWEGWTVLAVHHECLRLHPRTYTHARLEHKAWAADVRPQGSLRKRLALQLQVTFFGLCHVRNGRGAARLECVQPIHQGGGGFRRPAGGCARVRCHALRQRRLEPRGGAGVRELPSLVVDVSYGLRYAGAATLARSRRSRNSPEEGVAWTSLSHKGFSDDFLRESARHEAGRSGGGTKVRPASVLGGTRGPNTAETHSYSTEGVSDKWAAAAPGAQGCSSGAREPAGTGCRRRTKVALYGKGIAESGMGRDRWPALSRVKRRRTGATSLRRARSRLRARARVALGGGWEGSAAYATRMAHDEMGME
ncbi:hypothetical protein C8Q77DRAFT_888110 [Trametes polyzona]|nr:hypothetical protein C8Q77DRAFT_888110 [Trametes polyzona]